MNQSRCQQHARMELRIFMTQRFKNESTGLRNFKSTCLEFKFSSQLFFESPHSRFSKFNSFPILVDSIENFEERLADFLPVFKIAALQLDGLKRAPLQLLARHFETIDKLVRSVHSRR